MGSDSIDIGHPIAVIVGPSFTFRLKSIEYDDVDPTALRRGSFPRTSP